jgi:hypothetical protein
MIGDAFEMICSTAMVDMFGVRPTVTFFEACELRYTAFAVGLGFSTSACSLTVSRTVSPQLRPRPVVRRDDSL